MKRTLLAGVLLAAAVALPAAAQPRPSDNFTWSGRIPAGRWIRIRNLSGEITVGVATGDRVEVTATKHWRRGDPADVRFEVKKYGPGEESVVVCALWYDNTACDESHYETRTPRRSRRDDDTNDLNVEFRVLVPKGVKVSVNTVNGSLQVEGTTSDLDATTVNGAVDVVAEGGPVNAETVNGRVRGRIGRVDPSADMSFSTINGSVTVDVTGDVSADLDLSTVNGGVSTDYEVTVSGRLNPRRLRAHVGKPGGPRIKLSTVNGSVAIRRR